jgi:hypothetical protein
MGLLRISIVSYGNDPYAKSTSNGLMINIPVYLHHSNRTDKARAVSFSLTYKLWCAQRDSNSHSEEQVPKTCVSTNSTTGALFFLISCCLIFHYLTFTVWP